MRNTVKRQKYFKALKGITREIFISLKLGCLLCRTFINYLTASHLQLESPISASQEFGDHGMRDN